MAAWLVVATVLGVLAGGLGVRWVTVPLRQPAEPPAPPISNELIVEMIRRLLDASLPAAATSLAREDEMGVGAPHDPGELDDSEWAGARDWTDNLFGEERSTVGRLAPGESPIPEDPIARWRMMGDGAFDEWDRSANTVVGVVGGESWIEPIDLGNGEMVE